MSNEVTTRSISGCQPQMQLHKFEAANERKADEVRVHICE